VGIHAKDIVPQPRRDAAEVIAAALADMGTKLLVVTSRYRGPICDGLVRKGDLGIGRTDCVSRDVGHVVGRSMPKALGLNRRVITSLLSHESLPGAGG
jgi:hypothetical protein